MRLAPLVFLVTLALGCKDSTKPQDPWVGIWQLQSVDSLPLPADTIINGSPSRVVLRTLEVQSSGFGRWTDSTLSARTCGPASPPGALCDAGGTSGFSWTVWGDTLTFRRLPFTTIGYVANYKAFVKQADGSLLKTDDGQIEVYRR